MNPLSMTKNHSIQKTQITSKMPTGQHDRTETMKGKMVAITTQVRNDRMAWMERTESGR